jgi:hypothetical protein
MRVPPPRPACGERVGVRGLVATTQRPQIGLDLPLTRSRSASPTSPRLRGEELGWVSASSWYTDFRHEVPTRPDPRGRKRAG